MLDVLNGEIRTVADNDEAFAANVNSRAWQETHLLSLLVYELHGAGKIARGSECYIIAPHPAHGGLNPTRGDIVNIKFVLVVTLNVAQSLCRQALGGPP